MFAEAYLSTAQHLVDQYDLQMPLPIYLKNYFRENKKFGSRDRRFISELVFSFYRFPSDWNMNPRDRMLWGACLGKRLPDLFFEKCSPEIKAMSGTAYPELLAYVSSHFASSKWLSFPLSESVSEEHYLRYFFKPKSFFIRLRKQVDKTLAILKKHDISYERVGSHTLRFPQHLELKDLLPDPSSYVVQDIATQQCGSFLFPKDHQIWWDCCAASGGKSLMVLDKNPLVELHVSDIRESIIHNLKERLSTYGYSIGNKSYVMDASNLSRLPFPNPDVILCDVPCSGSGTWAQSPEQYYYFNEKKLNAFHSKQFDIASNTIRFLKPGGTFFYITCSIFQKENEEVIDRLITEKKLELKSKQIIDTSEHGGDFIFLAELLRSDE